MKKTLEKLWNEYFAEKLSEIETDKERELIKQASKFHEEINLILSEKQRESLEKYIESLYEIQNNFVKKVFSKGCEFGASFILEVANFENNDN